jgi:hypothetical protein
MADVRSGLAMIERDLARECINGKTYWLPVSDAMLNTVRSAHFLPLYDEYLIAYKDRSAAADPSSWTRASHDPFNAPVIVEGRMVGGWRRRVEKDRIHVTITPYRRLPRSDSQMIVEAAGAYGRFLGLDLELSWTGTTQHTGKSPG